jgi:hypothetical protein
MKKHWWLFKKIELYSLATISLQAYGQKNWKEEIEVMFIAALFKIIHNSCTLYIIFVSMHKYLQTLCIHYVYIKIVYIPTLYSILHIHTMCIYKMVCNYLKR